MVDILQTLGICIGSVALVFIAFFLFLITTRVETLFSPFTFFEDEDIEVINVDENVDEKSSRRTGRKYGKKK